MAAHEAVAVPGLLLDSAGGVVPSGVFQKTYHRLGDRSAVAKAGGVLVLFYSVATVGLECDVQLAAGCVLYGRNCEAEV